MYIVGSFRWQCVLLYVLGGNMCFWVFYVAICVVGSFRWQFELYVVGGNIFCCMF